MQQPHPSKHPACVLLAAAMPEEEAGSSETSPGPAPFVCAYLNGRASTIPPLLLALDGIDNVAALLTAARHALRSGGVDASPSVVYTPDGVLIPKAARVSDLRPNSVLVLTCGEDFDRASVPERARRMHANERARRTNRARVRAQPAQIPPDAPPHTYVELAHEPAPWQFSPSGRWNSPLALRPGYRPVGTVQGVP